MLMTSVADIPTAKTPSGGYRSVMPPAVLAFCSDPLAEDVPDLRGIWKVIDAHSNGQKLPDTFPIWNHRERIEQAANRVVITGGGVVHDMTADGTFENGLDDVMAADFTTPLVVAASYENDVLVLRPKDMPGIEVRRWLEGNHLMWQYHNVFTARLERVVD
jgi:hypothetical protein